MKPFGEDSPKEEFFENVPSNRQSGLPPNSLWKLIPGELPVRMLRVALHVRGFRTRSVTLVTTLVDAQEVARLYARRWRTRNWKCFSSPTT